MKALAYELGRGIKLIHCADLISGNLSETAAALQAIIQDARLADSVIAIDGFEHLLDEGGGAGGGETNKLHLVLSRLLGILHHFPGVVVLLCNIDAPQNIMLQRDFSSRLFCFLRFLTPPHAVRAKLWKRLLPARAPLASDASFDALGRKFELYAGSIMAACSRACAEAASRSSSLQGANADQCVIKQSDLMAAGEEEVAKGRGGRDSFASVCSLFV